MPSCHAQLPPLDLSRLSAVSVLHGEHDVILRILDCLERMAERAARARAMPILEARDAIALIRGFADDCHHAKEESLLFPALERIRPGFGPVQVMRCEHDAGRDHVRGMAIAVDAVDVSGFVQEARALSGLLREHIAKENEVLFPMAQAMLTPDDDAELVAGFRHAGRERPCGPLVARMDALFARYGSGDQIGCPSVRPRHTVCDCGAGTCSR